MLSADRLILAVADDSELVARKPQVRQILFSLFGARIAERQVIFVRPTLVRKPLDGELEVRVLFDNVGQRLSVRL